MINPESVAPPRFASRPNRGSGRGVTLARTDDPTLQRWARSHRPHLHQLLAADRFVDGLPLVGGQHVSVIGNAVLASTRVLRLVNSGVSCVAPGRRSPTLRCASKRI